MWPCGSGGVTCCAGGCWRSSRSSQAGSRLPRPIVPAGFAAGVLRRIEDRPSRWRRVADLLWTPRRLQLNLAGAALACASLVVAGGLMARVGLGWRTLQPGASPAGGESARVLVRLVVLQPEARTVQVAGDFNGWDPMKTPLAPQASGAWTVTLPLEPGRYKYMFVIDGSTWVADPFAAEETDDGFGARNAVLDVQPAGGTL